MTETKVRKPKTYIDIKFKGIFIASTLSMLIEYLMSLSDKIISGNMIGAEVLSAIILVEPFTLLAAFAACVLADITGAPVTEAIGKGDQKRAEQYFSQSLLLAVGIGLFLTVVYVVFTEQLVELVAGTSGQAVYVYDYFFWLRFLPVPMLLNAVLYPVVLYRGGEKYCNISAACSVLSNIGLSLILCYFDGVRGIGLGTVVGSCFGLFPLVVFMFSPKGKLRLSFYFSLRAIKNNLIYSLGGSLTYLYMAIFQIVMNLFLVERFSDNALVIFTGVINVVGLISALSDGIVEFLIPMLNTYQGEQNEIGCRNVMKKSLKASVTEGLVVTAVLVIFARVLAVVFGVEEQRLVADFVWAVRIYVLSSCFFYVTDLYSKYYLYSGKSVLSLVIGFLQNLVFPTVFGIGFGMMFGLKGIWIGMSVAQVVLFAVCYLILRRKKDAGGDLLFLDQDKMEKQYMWNIQMEQTQIMNLVDDIFGVLTKEGAPQKQINQAALAVEESQMHDLALNKDPGKVVIECSMLIGEKITLILRNTGVSSNILEETDGDALPTRLVSRMPGVSNSYILVNGNNRLIFQINRQEGV